MFLRGCFGKRCARKRESVLREHFGQSLLQPGVSLDRYFRPCVSFHGPRRHEVLWGSKRSALVPHQDTGSVGFTPHSKINKGWDVRGCSSLWTISIADTTSERSACDNSVLLSTAMERSSALVMWAPQEDRRVFCRLIRKLVNTSGVALHGTRVGLVEGRREFALSQLVNRDQAGFRRW